MTAERLGLARPADTVAESKLASVLRPVSDRKKKTKKKKKERKAKQGGGLVAY